MSTLFVILIIAACIVLTLIVLIQNPKGGGLAGNIAGFSNQFMGVKQTTDILEKGTWLFSGIVGVLCLVSVFFIQKSGTVGTSGETKDQSFPLPAQKPATNTTPNTVPMPSTPAANPGTAPATTPAAPQK